MSDSSILVFGSTGFIGKSFVLHLENEGWENVFVVNRTKNSLHGNKTHEFNFDEFQMKRHLQTYPKTTIVNMTNAYSKNSKLNHEQLAANLFHPLTLASELEDERQTFLQVGTYFEELGLAEEPFSYAWAKKTVSRLLSESNTKKGFRATVIKLFDVYGEGDTRPKLMNLLARHFSADNPKPLEMSCPRKQFFPVHIDDTVDAIKNSMAKSGSTTFASPQESYTLEEVVLVFQRLSKRKGSINWKCDGPKECKSENIIDERFTNSMAKISLEKGIERMLAYEE